MLLLPPMCTQRKCRNAPGISGAEGSPAVSSACRPQPPLILSDTRGLSYGRNLCHASDAKLGMIGPVSFQRKAHATVLGTWTNACVLYIVQPDGCRDFHCPPVGFDGRGGDLAPNCAIAGASSSRQRRERSHTAERH